jgi:hypothetical protein
MWTDRTFNRLCETNMEYGEGQGGVHQQDRTGDPAHGVDWSDGFEAVSDQPLNLADHQAGDGAR